MSRANPAWCHDFIGAVSKRGLGSTVAGLSTTRVRVPDGELRQKELSLPTPTHCTQRGVGNCGQMMSARELLPLLEL